MFSLIPDFSKTLKNVAHVTYTPVNSNKHSDILSMMRPLDADETAYMQASVERIYERFVSVVSEGRELEPDFVDSIGQGRVWSGRDALAIHLVDEIGTIEDAIRWAAEAASDDLDDADLKNWNVVGYPKPPTAMESLLEMFGGPSEEEVFQGTPLEGVAKVLFDWASSLKDNNASMMLARVPYELVWNR